MPGQADIAVLKAALPHHKGLSCPALLCGTAEIHNSALAWMLQKIILHRHSGLQTSGSQQMVAAAVTGRSLGQWLFHRHVRLLGKLRKGIVFAQKTDDRAAASSSG